MSEMQTSIHKFEAGHTWIDIHLVQQGPSESMFGQPSCSEVDLTIDFCRTSQLVFFQLINATGQS